MSDTIRKHLASVAEAIANVDIEPIARLATLLDSARFDGRRVYVLGNGACAALAAHLVTDLGKATAIDLGSGPDTRPAPGRLRVHSLADNAAYISALGNDVAFDDVFLEQVKNLVETGDIVIGLSGSGASPNVVRALAYAQLIGATTVGFTSTRASSAAMRHHCDVCLSAPVDGMEAIEDVHVALHHAAALALKAMRASSPAVPDDKDEEVTSP